MKSGPAGFRIFKLGEKLMGKDKKYCVDLFTPARLNSRIVQMGNLPLGGSFPVRIQSMTNTPTLDTRATVDQVQRLVNAGCEYVRITARNIAEANNLGEIKKQLHNKSIYNPIIADIHFNPDAALIAARIVEKVRINPGNFIDRQGDEIDWTNISEDIYKIEIEKIAAKIEPLVKICSEYGTAIRVGTNHGSLSKRILSRFGNTPEGMVQSALEFVRIFNGLGFHNLVLSMKASNIRIMVQSYRLLVNQMLKEGFDYPLHLGVTEAGAGDDGIIRSSAGIGVLLADGIGDTIRVSLTGPPENEIQVAKKLVMDQQVEVTHHSNKKEIAEFFNPFTYERYLTNAAGTLGNGQEVQLITKKEQLQYADSELNIISTSPGLARRQISSLVEKNNKKPIVLWFKPRYKDFESTRIQFAAEVSSLLIDGFGDAVWFDGDYPDELIKETGLSLLQAHGLIRSKAEFVSCPTCGRTEFDIEKVLNEIKARTSHLKHLKIAVMGCIVNGPGEMADADYGCVGSGYGKVVIYKRKRAMLHNVSESDAANEILQLIIKSGDEKNQ
jgi:(E)-4-hydroxy-3-methylbut-2-enyl-diphosphate synthase